MKIAIVGCGAMGSLIGGMLAKANKNVVLVDPWQLHVEAMNEKGLYMKDEGKGDEDVIKVNATTDFNSVGVVDAIILLVKGTKTVETVEKMLPMVDDDTIVMTLQNGLGNADKISEVINEKNVGFGVIDFSAVLKGPGRIFYQLADAKIACNTCTGEVTDRFNNLIEEMNDAGIKAYISEDAIYAVWNKLVINASYNVLCGITGIRMGELLHTEQGWKLMEDITKELVEVANKKGIDLDYDEAMEHIRDLGEKVSFHYPSLAQDVARKVPTEIDFLNGAIIREGKKVGVPTPVNETVYNLMKVIEENYEVGKQFVIQN